MTSLLRWTVYGLVIAALTHAAVVVLLPGYIVGAIHSQVSTVVGVNTVSHGPRVDETSRQVVRPSPDLLYSICPFDLSEGPVRFTAPIPPDTYASLSFFAMDSTNFHAENDEMATGGKFDLTLVTGDMGETANNATRTVVAPSAKGIALFRTLITDESALDRLDATRQEATCAPVN